MSDAGTTPESEPKSVEELHRELEALSHDIEDVKHEVESDHPKVRHFIDEEQDGAH